MTTKNLLAACAAHQCGKKSAVLVEQSYTDGSKVTLQLCRKCAAEWIKSRPSTSRIVPTR
jgi:hypothetical protein